MLTDRLLPDNPAAAVFGGGIGSAIASMGAVFDISLPAKILLVCSGAALVAACFLIVARADRKTRRRRQ